jgi:hypothetical protein
VVGVSSLAGAFLAPSVRADGGDAVDLSEVDCAVLGECAPPPPPPPPENTPRLCQNGLDDDADGLVDCLDTSCQALIFCLAAR